MTADHHRPSARPLVAHPVLRPAGWEIELGVWVSLYRFVFRRPRVPAGATGVPLPLPHPHRC